MDSSDDEAPELETLDISNDIYYNPIQSSAPKAGIHEDFLEVPVYGSPTIKHSLPAYDLWRPFFPTYLNAEKYRNFHRPKLRHYNTGPQALRKKPRTFPIKTLSRQISRYEKHLSNKMTRAIKSGMTRSEIVSNIQMIRRAKDLTAKQGEIILFEYSEEYPPVLSQVGMASNIKNYVQPDERISMVSMARQQVLAKSDRENHPASPTTTADDPSDKMNEIRDSSSLKADSSFGIREVLSSSKMTKPLYFSSLKPGTETQFIENNLYRAPIYQHQVPSTDFLIVRTRNSIYVRDVHTIFTVGQTMPLEVIPSPTDKAILNFRFKLSDLYIHRLFKESDSDPPEIDLNYLAKLFPDYSSTMLRKRLARRGVITMRDGRHYSIGTSNYGMGTLKDDRNILIPEHYCLSMSMLAARQRLWELDYSESMISPKEAVELETEVLAAPWNTSKAIHETIAGRCYLDFKKHLIDPTGPQREGFSCVSWVKSPTEEEQKSQMRTSSSSNNNNNKANATNQSISVELKNPLAPKIKREKLERLAVYTTEANLISKVQSEVLASREILSSDEDSDAEKEVQENALDSSFDRQLKDLDRLVVDGRTNDELNFEKEEEERRELMSRFVDNLGPATSGVTKSSQGSRCTDRTIPIKNRILKITRTYKRDNGTFQRTIELVRHPKIIDKYLQDKSQMASTGSQENQTQNGLPTSETTASPLPNGNCSSRSLGYDSPMPPTELCRADGIVLTISKSVLSQNRPNRRRSRENNHSFYL